MADYDGVFGYQDNANYPIVNISATAVYPRGGHHGSESNTYHGMCLAAVLLKPFSAFT